MGKIVWIIGSRDRHRFPALLQMYRHSLIVASDNEPIRAIFVWSVGVYIQRKRVRVLVCQMAPWGQHFYTIVLPVSIYMEYIVVSGVCRIVCNIVAVLVVNTQIRGLFRFWIRLMPSVRICMAWRSTFLRACCFLLLIRRLLCLAFCCMFRL